MKKIIIISSILIIILVIGAGCSTKKSLDFSVASMLIVPSTNTVVFFFDGTTNQKALIINSIKDFQFRDLSKYLSMHHKSITKATTSVEVWDIKYLLSPKSNTKTYHVSISLRKPLAPGEDFRGFAISGGSGSISFIQKKEVEAMLLQAEVILLDGIPHNLHYMSRKVRSFGKYSQGP